MRKIRTAIWRNLGMLKLYMCMVPKWIAGIVKTHLFWGKLVYCLILIAGMFLISIIALIIPLTLLERWLANDLVLLKSIGFFAIVAIPLLVTVIMLWVCKGLRNHIMTLAEYFRLCGDSVAVLVMIVIMYKTYYMSTAPPEAYSHEFLIVVLSNEGILGIPFFAFLIRFFINFYQVKENEANKKTLNNIQGFDLLK